MPLSGAPFFSYQSGALCVDGLPLRDLARQYGTPLFVYSQAAMLAALAAYQRDLAGRKALICYAVKANSSLAVLQTFARAGCGFDTVSGGEIERVLHAGGCAEKIIFSGVARPAPRCGWRCKRVLAALMWRACPSCIRSMRWRWRWGALRL